MPSEGDQRARGDVASGRTLATTSAPRRRVLIVDDEPLLVRALTLELAIDHDAVGVSSVKAALDAVAAGEFDVVLCDLMMPGESGMDLHRELLRLRPLLARRMVFMTGGAFTETARTFLESFPNPPLEKPFELDALRAALARPLGSP
jgi:DNA-binding NtrC family response regulator